MSVLARLAIVISVVTTLNGCADPVHDDAVDSLGPENPDVKEGPLHRAGQPCLVCHGGSGPGGIVMSVGGTIYQDIERPTPLVGATVKLMDAEKRSYTASTNCAGNFFVQEVDWAPVFPLLTEIAYGAVTEKMDTHIGRDGSCASCHNGHEGPASLAHVYLTDEPMTYPPSGCP